MEEEKPSAATLASQVTSATTPSQNIEGRIFFFSFYLFMFYIKIFNSLQRLLL